MVTDEFSGLTGAELSAVCFVTNFVELEFNGAILRFLAPPRVALPDRTVVFPNEGSRDALCALIGQFVQRAEDGEDRLTLVFAGDVKIEMPKASAGIGPEVAHFVPFSEGSPDVASMVIWENLVPTRDDTA